MNYEAEIPSGSCLEKVSAFTKKLFVLSIWECEALNRVNKQAGRDHYVEAAVSGIRFVRLRAWLQCST